jgi:hypothetical protein
VSQQCSCLRLRPLQELDSAAFTSLVKRVAQIRIHRNEGAPELGSRGRVLVRGVECLSWSEVEGSGFSDLGYLDRTPRPNRFTQRSLRSFVWKRRRKACGTEAGIDRLP